MKRFVCIFLLHIIVFNSIGYYGIFLILRKQFNTEFTRQLDTNEYSGNETMIVKIPFALPYQANLDAFERVDGEFECEGEFYKLVKQKWVDDTLFVILIKDSRQTKLHESLANFVQTSHDSQSSKSALKLIDHFEKDFISSINRLQVSSFGWCQTSSFGVLPESLNSLYHLIFSPPPELLFVG